MMQQPSSRMNLQQPSPRIRHPPLGRYQAIFSSLAASCLRFARCLVLAVRGCGVTNHTSCRGHRSRTFTSAVAALCGSPVWSLPAFNYATAFARAAGLRPWRLSLAQLGFPHLVATKITIKQRKEQDKAAKLPQQLLLRPQAKAMRGMAWLTYSSRLLRLAHRYR